MASQNPNLPNNLGCFPDAGKAPASYSGQPSSYNAPAHPMAFTHHSGNYSLPDNHAPAPFFWQGTSYYGVPSTSNNFYEYAPAPATFNGYSDLYNDPCFESRAPPVSTVFTDFATYPGGSASANSVPHTPNLMSYSSTFTAVQANHSIGRHFFRPAYMNGNATDGHLHARHVRAYAGARSTAAARAHPYNHKAYGANASTDTVRARPHIDRAFMKPNMAALSSSASALETNGTGRDQSVSATGCAICLDEVPVTEMMTMSNCSHRFCGECMKGYLKFKFLHHSGLPRCPDPGCTTFLQPADFKSILSPEQLQMMQERMEELVIPEGDRVYCPIPTCSALMSRSSLFSSSTSSYCVRCVKCEKFFCLKCMGIYAFDGSVHSCGIEMIKNDQKNWALNNVIQEKGWRQCPKCKHMIELFVGCFHIYCRCGHEFCYRCGAAYKPYGHRCSCPLWDETNPLYNPYW